MTAANSGEYEVAVYAEECDALTLAIKNVIKPAFDGIPDQRVRSAVTAAALLTAAQLLDGNEMPRETEVLKPNGVAENLAHLFRRQYRP